MYLEDIPKRKNRKMKGKRLGRGYGSGVGGHTSTRGTKGQKSRAGHKSLVFFEGGNVPFYRRMPKFAGFNKSDKVEATVINLDILEKNFKDGDGKLTKKISVEGIPTSESAKEKILKAGGVIK